MPRRFLRRYLPDHATLQKNRFLARFAHWFAHPNLWHLNRHSVAGGVVAGAIGGMIPGPLQVITASLLAMRLRANLPVAVVSTFYTNPLTIGPLYWLAFRLGALVTGQHTQGVFKAMPSWSQLPWQEWGPAGWQWLQGLGTSLLIGLPLLTALLAVAGYLLVQLGWRLHILWALRQRRQRAGAKPPQ
ncbi:hypothetical protein SAMN02745857_01363 [Andreprevotia lacus DSM 23236]|uniref:DUF2062 domain-containing protein n=1 Tax=Andreprevotia lacus DSM 23236 TaxID=1121001 RepID=A0A1W1XEA0_9NEIS|nr:DUF2062 domain-containing protein [Andreprevotia lacus]SMC22200.1 hypothetical protein SAMN02745857_01363 [Andreprevotia lacus DSM 23236]